MTGLFSFFNGSIAPGSFQCNPTGPAMQFGIQICKASSEIYCLDYKRLAHDSRCLVPTGSFTEPTFLTLTFLPLPKPRIPITPQFTKSVVQSRCAR